MPAGDITECRYIRYSEQQRYLDDGWELIPLIGNHARYSVLATKQISAHVPTPIQTNT